MESHYLSPLTRGLSPQVTGGENYCLSLPLSRLSPCHLPRQREEFAPRNDRKAFLPSIFGKFVVSSLPGDYGFRAPTLGGIAGIREFQADVRRSRFALSGSFSRSDHASKALQRNASVGFRRLMHSRRIAPAIRAHSRGVLFYFCAKFPMLNVNNHDSTIFQNRQ